MKAITKRYVSVHQRLENAKIAQTLAIRTKRKDILGLYPIENESVLTTLKRSSDIRRILFSSFFLDHHIDNNTKINPSNSMGSSGDGIGGGSNNQTLLPPDVSSFHIINSTPADFYRQTLGPLIDVIDSGFVLQDCLDLYEWRTVLYYLLSVGSSMRDRRETTLTIPAAANSGAKITIEHRTRAITSVHLDITKWIQTAAAKLQDIQADHVDTLTTIKDTVYDVRGTDGTLSILFTIPAPFTRDVDHSRTEYDKSGLAECVRNTTNPATTPNRRPTRL
jgi:hypothetical protein